MFDWFRNLKLWGIIGTIFGVIVLGLKIRGDHYKNEAEKAEDEIQRQIDLSEVKEFQAVNNERAKQTEVKDAGDTHSDTDSYDVSI